MSARAPHSPRLEAARAEAEAAAAAAGGGGNQRPARKAKGRPVSPLRLAAGTRPSKRPAASAAASKAKPGSGESSAAAAAAGAGAGAGAGVPASSLRVSLRLVSRVRPDETADEAGGISLLEIEPLHEPLAGYLEPLAGPITSHRQRAPASAAAAAARGDNQRAAKGIAPWREVRSYYP